VKHLALLLMLPLLVPALLVPACADDPDNGSGQVPEQARSERPHVDTRAMLDLTDLPDDVVMEMDGLPVAGVLALDAGPHRLHVHHGGRFLRSVTVDLRVGETVSPDLGWLPEAAAAARRHELTRRDGTCKCDEAEVHGIAWLVDHRETDGSWRADRFVEHCTEGTSCGGAVEGVSPVETTSLVLLALLGVGDTHYLGTYRSSVRGAVDFLVRSQSGKGRLAPSRGADGTLIQAIGTLALTETLVITGSPRFRDPAQASLDALLELRRPGFGWTRGPDSRRPDAETTAWAAFALASAHATDLDVPSGLREELIDDLGVFGDPGGTPLGTRVAAMLTLARTLLGVEASDPLVASGLERVLATPPSAGAPLDPMAVWFGATVVFRVGGKEAWAKWSRSLGELISEPLRARLEPFDHAPSAEVSPAALRLGRLRATIYRQLVHELYSGYGRVFGAEER